MNEGARLKSGDRGHHYQMDISHDPKRDAGSADDGDAIEATARTYADAFKLDPQTARLAAADVNASGDRKPSSDAVDEERAARAADAQPSTGGRPDDAAGSKS